MVWSINRQTAARPGHAHRLKSDPSTESEPSPRAIEERLSKHIDDNSEQMKSVRKSLTPDENHQLDDECLQRFIKMHVRLITEDHVSTFFQALVKSILII
jgi:hypothetical protein